jgi:hypothetical protein
VTAEEHAARQAALYQDIWAADPSYGTREADVKDTVIHRILPHMRRLPEMPVTVVDFGAGDGRFLEELDWQRPIPRQHGIGVDVSEPEHASWIEWHQQVLWQPLDVKADYAISTDTLEHIPTEMVPTTLKNIAVTAPHGFLRISTKQDIYGTERGLHLHETVEPPEWWLEQVRAAGITPSSWRIYPGHAVEIWF